MYDYRLALTLLTPVTQFMMITFMTTTESISNFSYKINFYKCVYQFQFNTPDITANCREKKCTLFFRTSNSVFVYIFEYQCLLIKSMLNWKLVFLKFLKYRRIRR
jgi:hypothetical protein